MQSDLQQQLSWAQEPLAVLKQSKLPSARCIFLIRSFLEYFQVSFSPRFLAFFSISTSRISASLNFIYHVVLPDPRVHLQAYFLAFFGGTHYHVINLHRGNGLGKISSMALYLNRISCCQGRF